MKIRVPFGSDTFSVPKAQWPNNCVLLAVLLDLLRLSPLLLDRLDDVSCRHQHAARCLVAQHLPHQVGILLDSESWGDEALSRLGPATLEPRLRL